MVTFRTADGEHVMAVTSLVPYAAGNVTAMRLVTSLTLVDRQWYSTLMVSFGVAAVVLGVGRAIGEAMAIILVAGNVSNMPGLFTPVRFLTTGIISGMAYASVGSLYQQALYSIGLVLFLFIMLINVFLNVCVKNRKEG